VLRQEVFAGHKSPVILGEPEPWMAQAVEALRRACAGDYAAACQLRDDAWADAPATPGRLWLRNADGSNPAEESGIDFDWIADCDTRLGPFLEVIVDGRYYWAPLHRIEKIGIEPPADLRDRVWMPAQFIWANQGQAVGMIPTRYPASESADDPEIRLARRSEWREPAEGVLEGLGQRVLATDAGEFALMDVHKIELRPEAAN
jgi:type VI secretion system protein ImpE